MQVNIDFDDALNDSLGTQPIIQQCIISDYALSDDKSSATCTVTLPNYDNGDVDDPEPVILKNIQCLIGSAVDITWSDYMSGILINLQNPFTTAQSLSEQKAVTKYDFFNFTTDNLLAIVLPHSETIANILTAKIQANETARIVAPQIYAGDDSTNVLNELSEYLQTLKTFFDNLVQYVPTIALQPGSGAAQVVAAAQQISTETDTLYNKISPIVALDPEDE